MKKVLLSTVALVGLTAGAMAADLPVRTMAPAPAPVMVAPVFTWTGFYVGVSGGYLWNDVDADLAATGGATAGLLVGAPADIPGSAGFESDGFLVGGTIGANMQFGMFVAGIEADLSFVDNDSSESFVTAGGLATTTFSSEMNAFGTVRGRLGLAFDRFMIYGTGGLAFADIQDTVTVAPRAPAVFTPFSGQGSDDWRVGWTAGVGGEFAITNNLTFKVEYLHYEFEGETVRATGAAATDFVDYNVEHSGELIRGGINFKF